MSKAQGPEEAPMFSDPWRVAGRGEGTGLVIQAGGGHGSREVMQGLAAKVRCLIFVLRPRGSS